MDLWSFLTDEWPSMVMSAVGAFCGLAAWSLWRTRRRP